MGKVHSRQRSPLAIADAIVIFSLSARLISRGQLACNLLLEFILQFGLVSWTIFVVIGCHKIEDAGAGLHTLVHAFGKLIKVVEKLLTIFFTIFINVICGQKLFKLIPAIGEKALGLSLEKFIKHTHVPLQKLSTYKEH